MTASCRLRARHYATGEPVVVTCAGERITSIEPGNGQHADLEAGWVAPALFDLQINGCDGHSFNSEKLKTETVRHVVDVCRQHGVGSLCPTLVTNSFAALAHGLTTIDQACAADQNVAAAVAGIHVEGPYISPEDGPRGAHPKAHVRAPDWDEFRRLQEAAAGRIRLLTLAPEHEGAIPFIEKVVGSGVVVALGHTAASRTQIADAVRAGATLSTHLGNGSHAVLPRHDNYIWEQLADDRLWASVICDGHHLPASVVRVILRVKTPARTVLTCDASSLAGLPAGRYREWDQDFDITPAGKILVAGTTYLAGAWAFTDLCLGNVLRYTDVSLRDAIDMATIRPRQLLGLPVHQLEPGAPADLVLFDWQPGGNFQVKHTLVHGER
ncbi:MAG: N-acetylglucosamine-6-phosphate deacetylase [Gemmataceae bacterium]